MDKQDTHKDQINHLYGVIDRLEKRMAGKDTLLREALNVCYEYNKTIEIEYSDTQDNALDLASEIKENLGDE